MKHRSISWYYISDVLRARNQDELGRSHTKSQCWTVKCRAKTRVRLVPTRPFFRPSYTFVLGAKFKEELINLTIKIKDISMK